MAGQQVKLAPTLYVPNPQTLVSTTGKHSAAVRAKGHHVHRVRMAVGRQRSQPPNVVHGIASLLQGCFGIGSDKTVCVPGGSYGSLCQQEGQRGIIRGLSQQLIYIVRQFIGLAAASIGLG
jgi:hypothetical protein